MTKDLPRLITLTSDLGAQDPISASIKGVLFSKCPGVRVVDMGNEISCHSVREAAMFLLGAVPFYPKGTVHLVTIAPGPDPVAIKIAGQYIVCPDNGVATLLGRHFEIEETRSVTIPEEISSRTCQIFYGRELFAPVAASLADTGDFAAVGPVLEKPAEMDWPEPTLVGKDWLDGTVVHINRFGNLITNIHRSHLEDFEVERVAVAGSSIHGLSLAYDDVEPKRPLALVGHYGFLEIAYRGDRADQRLSAVSDSQIRLFLRKKGT